MNKRIARWEMLIQGFDCKFQHRKGTSMMHVDALSRTMMVGAVDSGEMDLDQRIQITQTRDTNIQSIRERLERGEFNGYIMEDGLIFKIGSNNQKQPRKVWTFWC